MKIENWPIPFWHLLSIKQLDTSRELDQKDRAEFGAWLIGCLLATGIMAVNDLDGFKLSRYRLQSMASIALTCVAVHITDKATRKYAEVYGVLYRNEAQRNMDEAVTETTVFYQHQIADLQLKWQQYVAHLIAKHDSEIDAMMNDNSEQVRALKAQHQEAIQTLQYQISDYLTDIEVLEEKVSALKAQKFHEQEQARCDAQDAMDLLKDECEALQRVREELALSEQRLEAREQQIKHEAHQIWEQERDRLQAEQERLDAFQSQLDTIEEQYHQEAMQLAQEAVMADIKGYQEMITLLRDEIGSMLRSKPIKGTNREALVANTILDALEDMGVFLHRTSYGYDGHHIWVAGYPLPTINGEKLGVEMALSHIWHELDRPKPLKHIQQSAGALNPPKVSADDNERLRVEVDLSPIDRKAVEVQQALEEKYFFPVEDERGWLRFIDAALHINFMAMSGRGKTTLLDNIINLLFSQMGPDTDIRHANPKPDRKDYSFRINWIGIKESVYGLFEAAIEIRHRVDTNNRIQRQRQDTTRPEQKPEFVQWSQRLYFFDEINVIVNYFKGKNRDQVEEFFDTVASRLNLDWERTQTFEEMRTELNHRDVIADLIKFTWRVGRSEKIKMVMAGQNLMPSQLSSSMTKDDAYSQAYICSGETAINRAKNEGVIKADIYSEAIKGVAAEEDNKINPFWGVFAPARGSGKPFISQFPSPGQYDLETMQENPQAYLNGDIQPTGDQIASELLEQLRQPGPDAEPKQQNPKPDSGFLENPESLPTKEYGDSQNPDLPCENQADMGDISNPTPAEPNPEPILSSNLSEDFYDRVLSVYQEVSTVSTVIEIIWGLKRSRSIEYQVAKWKVRHVLNVREIIFEKKISEEDRKRDRMSYDELLDYLENK